MQRCIPQPFPFEGDFKLEHSSTEGRCSLMRVRRCDPAENDIPTPPRPEIIFCLLLRPALCCSPGSGNARPKAARTRPRHLGLYEKGCFSCLLRCFLALSPGYVYSEGTGCQRYFLILIAALSSPNPTITTKTIRRHHAFTTRND